MIEESQLIRLKVRRRTYLHPMTLCLPQSFPIGSASFLTWRSLNDGHVQRKVISTLTVHHYIIRCRMMFGDGEFVSSEGSPEHSAKPQTPRLKNVLFRSF